jgi:hypothetical protein
MERPTYEVPRFPDLVKILETIKDPSKLSSLAKFLIVGGSIVTAEAALTCTETYYTVQGHQKQVPLKSFGEFVSEPLYRVSGERRSHGTFVFSYIGLNAGLAFHNYQISQKITR